jgi:hypothetical protein
MNSNKYNGAGSLKESVQDVIFFGFTIRILTCDKKKTGGLSCASRIAVIRWSKAS